MKAGSRVGLVMAGFVVFVCAVNLVLAIAGGSAVAEILLWIAGVLVGLGGIVVFSRNIRAGLAASRRGQSPRSARAMRK